VRHNHLTFAVGIDTKDISVKTWNVQGWPYWLLASRCRRRFN
jgi:hypothetical protein